MLSDEEIERASRNYEAQTQLVDEIRAKSRAPVEAIADDLGVDVDVAQFALDGMQDLTLTELRYLANAARLTITYKVEAR